MTGFRKYRVYADFRQGSPGRGRQIALGLSTSGRLADTRVDQSKTVEARIMQLSQQDSPMTLVLPCRTSLRNSKGYIGSECAK